mgnify:CR=1 FL=1
MLMAVSPALTLSKVSATEVKIHLGLLTPFYPVTELAGV